MNLLEILKEEKTFAFGLYRYTYLLPVKFVFFFWKIGVRELNLFKFLPEIFSSPGQINLVATLFVRDTSVFETLNFCSAK